MVKWIKEIGCVVAVGWLSCSASWAQGGPGESSFVDERGVITLTDRPEVYRAEGGYLEIALDYEPIQIIENWSFTRTGRIETNSDYKALIRHYAQKYNLDKNMVQAVIKAESNFDPYAVSSAGAQGLMQLMPATAAEMSIRNPFDPGQNIAGGTQYLYKLMQLFDNDIDLVLAGYNAGPGNVKKYGGIPPFKETQNYVKRVKHYMNQFSGGRASVVINRNTTLKQSTFKPTKEIPYVVHMKNGTIQPAEGVREEADKYVLTYKTREYPVHKTLVERIDKFS
jgi:hypothetical protein